MTDFELGWITGLIEGEGTFNLKYGRYPRIAVQMNDLDTLEKLLKIVGSGYITGPYQREDHHQLSWKWDLQHSEKAANLLKLMLPHLGERRAQKAREILAGYEEYEDSKPTLQKDQECIIEDCDKPRVGRKMCNTHYEYHRRRNWELL